MLQPLASPTLMQFPLQRLIVGLQSANGRAEFTDNAVGILLLLRLLCFEASYYCQQLVSLILIAVRTLTDWWIAWTIALAHHMQPSSVAPAVLDLSVPCGRSQFLLAPADAAVSQFRRR
jgi:hypothetical protein